MKRFLLLLLLISCSLSLNAQTNGSIYADMSVGAGFSSGPGLTVMPSFLVMRETESGFAFGPGIGIRAGYITYSINKAQISEPKRKFQKELDFAFFYRLRYDYLSFCSSLDFGGDLGLYAHRNGSQEKPIYHGLFLEPQIGYKLAHNQMISLGCLFHQTSFTVTSMLQDDVYETTTYKNVFSPALILHYCIAL